MHNENGANFLPSAMIIGGMMGIVASDQFLAAGAQTAGLTLCFAIIAFALVLYFKDRAVQPEDAQRKPVVVVNRTEARASGIPANVIRLAAVSALKNEPETTRCAN